MLDYNEIYETLRKEKYSEALQPLPKEFINDYKQFILEKKETGDTNPELFSEAITKSKKQLENAQTMFRELILKRKKKILNLVFIATETGTMKRDYENMLKVEQRTFEKLTQAFQGGDKEMTKLLSEKTNANKQILFNQDVEEFVNHRGEPLGPFKSGEQAEIDESIAQILITEKKAKLIDIN